MIGHIISTPTSAVAVALTTILMLLSSKPVSSESTMTRLLTDYTLLKDIADQPTGMHVELGLNANFSSYDVELTLYDKPLEERWSLETGVTLFSALRVPEDVKLSFNGNCYVVTYDFIMDDIILFEPSWKKPDTGEAICIRLASPDGKRMLVTPQHRP